MGLIKQLKYFKLKMHCSHPEILKIGPMDIYALYA